MLVGIISDTHGRLPHAAYAELADCGHIIHAGDIGGPDILDELRAIAPVAAVLGNNDIPEYGDAVGRFAAFEIEGVRFVMAHEPERLESVLSGRTSALKAGDPVPHVAIHGHTHVPRIERGAKAFPAQMIVCPGSPTRPRGGSRPSVAKMEVSQGAVRDVRIVEVGE